MRLFTPELVKLHTKYLCEQIVREACLIATIKELTFYGQFYDFANALLFKS